MTKVQSRPTFEDGRLSKSTGQATGTSVAQHPSTDLASTLSDIEARDLALCEENIENGLATIGHALERIRDRRLYRASHATFEDYCRSRWGISKTHGNRMIAASRVIEQMTPIGAGTAYITNESQARAIAPIIEEHGVEFARHLVVTVYERSGRVTVAAIQATAAQMLAPVEDDEDEVIVGEIVDEDDHVADVVDNVVPLQKPTAKPVPTPKPTPAKPKPARRGKHLTGEELDQQLDLAVRLLGEAITALSTGQLHPDAAARVIVRNLVNSTSQANVLVALDEALHAEMSRV